MQKVSNMLNKQDTATPSDNIIFEPVYDSYGLRLALVFGNQAKDGICPYYRSNYCHHCDIGAGEGVEFDTITNLRRLEWFKEYYKSLLPKVAHLVIYNSGSTLNKKELSPDVSKEIMLFAKTLPKLQLISMDSREVFIETNYIKELATILGEKYSLRVIIGLESIDEDIRNTFLNKNMSKYNIEKAIERFSNAWLDKDKGLKMAYLGLSINIVVGAPGTKEETIITDSINSVYYALDLAKKYDLPLDINLHPYYPSKKSLSHFPNHLETSTDITEKVVDEIKKILPSNVHLFVGHQDEGHNQSKKLK